MGAKHVKLNDIAEEGGGSALAALMQSPDDRIRRDVMMLLNPEDTDFGNLQVGYTTVYPHCTTRGHSHGHLEEVYFYKIDRPEGFAYQRIYTPDRKIDELLLARDSHLILSPRGYHPVVAAPGYNCYYLNMLAGSAQSLAATDDPDYAWVKETWKEKDPRLPLVNLEMEK